MSGTSLAAVDTELQEKQDAEGAKDLGNACGAVEVCASEMETGRGDASASCMLPVWALSGSC